MQKSGDKGNMKSRNHKQMKDSNSSCDELFQVNIVLVNELQHTFMKQLPENSNPGARFLLEKLPDIITEAHSNRSTPLDVLKHHERKRTTGMTVTELQNHLKKMNNNLISLLAKNTLHNYIELCRVVVEQSSVKQIERAA